MTLPQLTDDRPYLADGGLETSIIYRSGIDLPDFAAFPLLTTAEGRATLTGYYEPFLTLAADRGLGLVIDTPTWRASLDWGARLGFDGDALARVNRDAVRFVADLASAQPGLRSVTNGAIGPRGDGYVAEESMSAAEAASYHDTQVRAFADAGAGMVSAITMTHTAEAIGIVRACVAAGLPAVVSFTVETDGLLPSGQPLGEAIAEVDGATDGAPAYFMINCAHPTHFPSVIADGDDWHGRVKGIRANASALSHEELDAATELHRGDPAELAGHYVDLGSTFDLRVVGGCCGTDDEHVATIADALVA